MFCFKCGSLLTKHTVGYKCLTCKPRPELATKQFTVEEQCLAFGQMVAMASQNLGHAEKFGREIKDIESWCYELVMSTVYGRDVYKLLSWLTTNE